MESMTRDEMIQVLSVYCQSRPVTGCPSCPIRISPANGMGCVKIKDRTDKQLAAGVEKIKPEEPPIEKLPEPEQPSIRYMVTVDRDLLQSIKGELGMLSCCEGAMITEKIANELNGIAAVIQHELDACDLEAVLAEKAMHEALQREREALMKKEEESNE